MREMMKELIAALTSLITSLKDAITPILEKQKRIMPKPVLPSRPRVPGTGELAQIKADEGFEAGVYEDTMGIKTIGYGFNLERAGSKEALEKAGIEKSVADLASGKAKLTEEEASQLMLGEMGHFKLVAKRFVGEDVWKNLSGNRQGIITNMAYNMGEGTLKQFKKLRAAIRGGDWQEAQVQMADSDWSKQVKGRSDRLIARMGQNDTGIQLASAGAPGGAGSGGRSNVIIAPSTVNQNNNNTPLYIEENSFANNQAIDFHRA
jgi:GH24 family phage-related lysozyme (muramidase)